MNTTTVLRYLSGQSSLADSAAGRDRRRAVLLRSEPRWEGPAEATRGEGPRFRVATAPSPLAVHELLLDHFAEGATGPAVLVVLTDREENELDPALLARVHKRCVDTVDNWNLVRDAFGARQIDRRLTREKWAAEALLDATPPGGWPHPVGDVLSRRTALASLALRRLRLGRYAEESTAPDHPGVGGELDIHTLLGWSLAPGRPEHLLELRGPERAGLVAFLGEEEQAGAAGRTLLALVEAGHGPDAVAFGLVCGALWGRAEPDAAVYTARGRAERWFGENPPAVGERFDALAGAFGRAAEEYVRGLLDGATRDDEGLGAAHEVRRTALILLERASTLARQLGAETAARASLLLPAGLDARFTVVGRALADGEPAPVAAAIRELAAHLRARAPEARPRVERTRMALRLLRWTAGGPTAETSTVAAGLERHMAETGWVDRALEHVEAGGDPDPVLAAAYDKLAARVREHRHRIDGGFARALAGWTEAGTAPGAMLTVETFLERVVRPVVRGAGDRRVLLLVLDGMSAAIATELGEELRSSWAEFDPLREGVPRRRPMAAALPTITVVSRASLLTGRLTRGAQREEKLLFPTLPLWGGAPAALFHKEDLRADSAGETFGPALTEALADDRTHVAVVLNAIDDRLAKERKLGDGAWRAEHIPGLPDLLRVAATRGMAVVITSDHGHVVDRHGNRVEAGAPLSARHRAPGGETGPAEVALSGPRVVEPDPGGSIVALWDADSRYTARKAGYHGGASLAEVAIPILVLLPFGAEPPTGWRELGDQRPAWWALDSGTARPEEATAHSPAGVPRAGVPGPEARKEGRKEGRKQSRRQEGADRPQDSLFDVALVPATGNDGALVTPTVVNREDVLIEGLLASETFGSQIDLLARKPPMGKVEKAIRVLLEAGGTLPVTALAQRVDYPIGRANGFAAVLRQLLNHDGAQVLEILPDGRTVRLNPTLLRTQFGLT
ncbi:BREX-2 system phosphatase PglZ [Streptomyces sp. ST2-7A]|uniref:BREX-2 system phosphatase PglZ n=1 Tax=Streptomyces sp. ST2-7A TaxID=2907214 RepID=UPI001F40CECA|nr:BREX-2 system phosphatase PglZ [Streptomyces sp. ST2-7A]MCE7080357.1 BREX-2 system phosphatase PglZ [Streptomyces sp. ST2-7A]